jgi:hypothetical protein
VRPATSSPTPRTLIIPIREEVHGDVSDSTPARTELLSE